MNLLARYRLRTASINTPMHRLHRSLAACLLLLATLRGGYALGFQSIDEFETAPIRYSATSPNDPVHRLWERFCQGEVQLAGASRSEKLQSLLELLEIPVSSQVLVFSKTSLQISKIGPRTPRAIYFNDHTYVGFIPTSDTIELVSVDPNLGAIFYLLEPTSRGVTVKKSTLETSETPESTEPESTEADNDNNNIRLDFAISRDKGQCLSCHATSRTERVPGTLVRSIYSDRAGRPRTGASSYVTDYRSPFEQRWGGWYVTGSHGEMRHMGNALALDRDEPEKLDLEQGANWESLREAINIRPYLLDSSDIVSLMVLEHQSSIQNLITRANFETKQAIHLDETMNRALERPMDHRSDSTRRRINNVAKELVRGLLFIDEFELTAPVEGNSTFTKDFSIQDLRLPNSPSAEGPSLRDFDLKTRLFKYACSYLILSEQFEALPSEVQDLVLAQIRDVLQGQSQPSGRVLWDESCRQETLVLLQSLRPAWFPPPQ